MDSNLNGNEKSNNVTRQENRSDVQFTCCKCKERTFKTERGMLQHLRFCTSSNPTNTSIIDEITIDAAYEPTRGVNEQAIQQNLLEQWTETPELSDETKYRMAITSAYDETCILEKEPL